MIRSHSILVPVDLSSTSKAALRYASHIGRWLGVDLSVLYATDFGGEFISASRAVVEEDRRAIRDEKERVALETIDEWCQALPEAQRATVRTSIVDEDPTDAILERSTRHDFLVVGTRHVYEDGRPDWSSVTNQVIRRSFRPVFVVREGMAEIDRDASLSPATRILLTADVGDLSDAEFLAAREMGERFVGATVQPLYVASSDSETASATKTLERAIKHYELRCETPAVVTGDPVDVIPKYARKWQCDLIILSTHGRKGIGRLLLGSVAEGVLKTTPCPVLALRDPVRRRSTFHDYGNE